MEEGLNLNKKKCNKCKEEKLFLYFCRNKNTLDGYHRYCKKCKSEENIRNKDYNINYYYKNKEKYNDIYYHRQNKLKRDKYNNDPVYKISILLRNRLSKILKRNGIYKTNKTIKLLGCEFIFFKKYIEIQFKEGMNWNNHGLVWELDHIKPISKFNLILEKDQKECFHYTNLQPLFSTTKIAESLGYINEIGNRNKSNLYEI